MEFLPAIPPSWLSVGIGASLGSLNSCHGLRSEKPKLPNLTRVVEEKAPKELLVALEMVRASPTKGRANGAMAEVVARTGAGRGTGRIVVPRAMVRICKRCKSC